MKYTSALLMTLSLGIATATAGVSTSTYSGKEQTTTPPPLTIDRCAGPISYSNIELLYANTDWGFGDSTDGGILRAEYSPMEHFYITGSVEYSDIDTLFVQDLWDFSIGLGGYFALTENIHFAADVGYVNRRYDDLNDNGTVEDALDDFWHSESDSGWYARPHFRGKWGCFEVHVGALYRNLDVDDEVDNDFFDGGDWAGFARLYYQFHTNWDVTAGYLHGEDEFDQLTLGVRYRF
jgi:hypothetical protein